MLGVIARHRIVTALLVLLGAGAVVLWSKSASDIPRAVLEAKYATPPSKFLSLGEGTRVHYRDRGPRDAPVLVLLHGFSGSLFGFEAWSRALSDKYRVVSLDLPGSGLTGAVAGGDYSQGAMTDFVKAFADRLGLTRFALAGNSMGGGIAARFAERFPRRVSALILIDAPGAPVGTRSRWNLRYRFARTPLLSDVVLVLRPPGEFNRMTGTRAAMLEHYRLAEDDFVWRHRAAITAPTLVLWGAKDRTIPVASAHAWAAAIKGATLKIYPSAGHTPMIDAAAQSAGDVRAFLARLR
jgi:pimeloyl-ACP methyl ester carboxylesterase